MTTSDVLSGVAIGVAVVFGSTPLYVSRKRKNVLSDLKADFTRLAAGESATLPELPHGRNLLPDSATSKVLAYAREYAGKYINATTVVNSTGLSVLDAGRALYRLGRKGELENPRRGVYIAQLRAGQNGKEAADAAPSQDSEGLGPPNPKP